MGTLQESVTIVDDRNRVVGAMPRHEMRARGLPHRAAYILVFNRRGELFVQQRTLNKDVYPGCYDVAAGGVVLAGESYEEAAQRELAEELGICGVTLASLFDFFHQDHRNTVWGRVFLCVHDGPMVLQAEEVAAGAFVPLAEIFALAGHKPFTPDGLLVLQRYVDGHRD